MLNRHTILEWSKETAEVGERRLWSSGLWEKQPDKTWKLVPGYRKILRRLAAQPNVSKEELAQYGMSTRDLRKLRKDVKTKRPGCPKGQYANPTSAKCISVRKIANNVSTMLNSVADLKDLPGSPTSKLVQATQAFKEWQDWYARAGASLAEIFGMHKDMAIGVFAATSAATKVDANVTLALKALRIIATTPPNVEPDFSGFMEAHAENLKRILRNEPPEGPKIKPFSLALRGDTTAIPIDRHISRVLFGKDSPDEYDHAVGQKILQRVAKKLGIDGRDVQAALWALSISSSGETPQSYEVYLVNKRDEIDDLVAALTELQQTRNEGQLTASTERHLLLRLESLAERIRRRL